MTTPPSGHNGTDTQRCCPGTTTSALLISRRPRVAALHEPTQARTLSERYLLPLDTLEARLAQRLVDARFPDGAAHIRLNGDGTLNYVQHMERLPVILADDDHIEFTTWYPAGPLTHHTPRSIWDHGTGDITIPDPDGDGSRILSGDHTMLTDDEQERLPAHARRSQQQSPWWTAPFD